MNFNNINIQPIRIEDIELMRKWRNNENDKGVFFNNKYITKEEQENWYEKYKNNIDVYDCYSINPLYIRKSQAEVQYDEKMKRLNDGK